MADKNQAMAKKMKEIKSYLEMEAIERLKKGKDGIGKLKQTERKQKAMKALTPQEDQPKSIDPQQVREQRKQEQKLAGERIQKRRMTEDYAYTDKFNTKGPHSRVAEATAKGVRIARRGGGRAYGQNS